MAASTAGPAKTASTPATDTGTGTGTLPQPSAGGTPSVGTIDLAIPRVRSGSYFPGWLLERRRRSEQALISVVATCYLLGVSTRRVEKLAESLGVTQLSKSQVSQMAGHLDDRVAEFRNRPLDQGPYTFVWVDALTQKAREGGRVVNVHALVAVGVNNDGHREILGIDIAASEDGAGWTAFLRSLVARGLSGVKLVVSDAHAGLVDAIGGVPGLGGVDEKDSHLGVLDPACGARVLALYPDGRGSLLQVPGLVHDQHGVLVAEMVDHEAPHVVADSVSVPGRSAEQMPHAGRTCVTGMLGDRPAVLPREVGKQAEHERPRPATRLHSGEPARHLGHQALECLLPNSRHYAGVRGGRVIIGCPHNT